MKSAYFIGIGGIGMSALARYYTQKGWNVSGYDKTETRLTRKLVSENLKIYYEEKEDLIPKDADLYVYTPAMPKDSTTLNLLRDLKKDLFKRSEVLGLISKDHNCLAVAGTHGKTTTSAILAHILRSAGWDPTAFIGGVLNSYESNLMLGESDWMVTEADEYDRSFLKLHPDSIILTSMDADHLDIYEDESNMRRSYLEFLSLSTAKVLIHSSCGLEMQKNWIEYGDRGKYVLKSVECSQGKWHVNLDDSGNQVKFSWTMPGKHNAFNAIGAYGLLRELDMSAKEIIAGLESFPGIKRRYQRIGNNDGRSLVLDYAHHPTEIKAAIDTARLERPEVDLTVIFQPHLYTRTRDFLDEFARELDEADVVILTEIYPAREEPIEGVDSIALLKKITLNNKYVIRKNELCDFLEKIEVENCLVLGAGDLDQNIIEIAKSLKINV